MDQKSLDTPMDTASPVDQASMDADDVEEKPSVDLNDSSMESPRPAMEAMDQGGEAIADAAMTSPAAVEDKMETASPEGVVSMEAEEPVVDTTTSVEGEGTVESTTSREDENLDKSDSQETGISTQDYSSEGRDEEEPSAEVNTQDFAPDDKDDDQQSKDIVSAVSAPDDSSETKKEEHASKEIESTDSVKDDDLPSEKIGVPIQSESEVPIQDDSSKTKDDELPSKESESAVDTTQDCSSENKDGEQPSQKIDKDSSAGNLEESKIDDSNQDRKDDESSEITFNTSVGMITDVVGNVDAGAQADGKEGEEEAPMFQISCVQSGVSMENEESTVGGESQKAQSAEAGDPPSEKNDEQAKKDKAELETVTRVLSPSQIKQEVEDTVSETTPSQRAESPSLSSAASVKVKSEPVDNETRPSEKPKESKKGDKPKSKKSHKCIVCGTVGKCKYNIVRNGDVKHLCNDQCFKTFRANPSQYLANSETEEIAPSAPAAAPAAPAPTRLHVPKNACRNCRKSLQGTVQRISGRLTWQSSDFCGIQCLEYYQRAIVLKCQACGKMIHHGDRAQHSVLIYNKAYQFCSADCQDDYTSSVSQCAFCRIDLTEKQAIFKRGVNNGTFVHEFCSATCHKSFERRSAIINPSMNSEPRTSTDKKTGRSTRSASGLATCAACGKMSTYKHELHSQDGVSRLCNDTCYAAFRIKNKLASNLCGYCSIPCDPADIQMLHDDMAILFCAHSCMARFKRMNKEQVACSWCAHKRTNFDMIQSKQEGKGQLFCTPKCLQLYRTNIENSKIIMKCDNCDAKATAQYHLTMSDGTVRNFCSYSCVMIFQDQFKKKPTAPLKQLAPKAVQYQTQTAPVAQARPPTVGQLLPVRTMVGGVPTVVMSRSNGSAVRTQAAQSNAFPVISNVMSLAPLNKEPAQKKATTTSVSMQTVVKKETVIQQPAGPMMRNKVVLCKPICQTKATTCRPNTVTIGVNTEPLEDVKIPIPMPVPIYVPVPVIMYQMPTPQAIPIPVPVPIPIFIPTGGGSAQDMIDRMNAVKERIPEDPFEAELLMMAEAVAGADSESDQSPVKGKKRKERNGDAETSKDSGALFQNDADILSMALKMAERMEGDEMVHLDLESSLDANSGSEAESSRRGTKRGASKGRTRSSKRARTEEPAPVKPAADADCLLKFTYGLNAWEHWVRQKNNELDTDDKKPRSRPFKTDPLECSPDELNYALSLFVREVRKPNGAHYAADSIYYLCLGIQAYLYSNQRTDNIFTDIYYEKFTDCLNEMVRGYRPKLSAAGQLICRLDEEHLWECKQLGAHSPHVLLNTLIYFNTRFFQMATTEQHLKLAFTQVMKAWKRNPPGTQPSRTVYLRYYPPSKEGRDGRGRRKDDHEENVLEQMENTDNPLRCPVKLFEFYVSKCPECVRNRSDLFYLIPERSCVPDSPVWYSVSELGNEAMDKMLTRVKMVRELQEA